MKEKLVREYLDQKWEMEETNTPSEISLANGLTSPSQNSPKSKGKRCWI